MSVTMSERRAKLTSAERDALPDSAFALPGRRYPIHDLNHAHAALSEVAQHGTPEEKAKVRAAVHKRYPGIKIDESKAAQHDPAFELRKRRRSSMIRQAERRGMLLEVRAKPDGTGGTDFVFEGYGSVFDTPFEMWDRWGDPYTEIVKQGAFTRSLARPDLDVPFLVGHDDKAIAMARTKNGTLRLAQDSRGMLVEATLDGRRSDVRNLAYAVERGDQDEMSVGFVTLGQEWSDDYETRSMLDLDIHRGDVSSVALAAIPETAGSSIAFPAETLRRRAPERRSDPGDEDLGGSSDYNPPGLADRHAFTGVHAHPHADGDGGMHDHLHEHDGDAGHNHDHGGDALIRINDDGVPPLEEVQGAAASLALRRRQLELLKLSARTEVA